MNESITNLDIILGRTETDKNSKKFDKALLNDLIGTTFFGNQKKFLAGIRKWMRYKTSCKLWYEFKEGEKWDGKENRKYNFICCPSSHKANYYFCFTVDFNNIEGYKIIDGFLANV